MMSSLTRPTVSTGRCPVNNGTLVAPRQALSAKHVCSSTCGCKPRSATKLAALTPLHALASTAQSVSKVTTEGPRDGWAVMEAHGKLKPWTRVMGPLGELEVDIKVTCNGLCMSDMSMRDNHWGISAFPFIPGHEVVGVVQAVGHGVKSLKVGQRAGVGWIGDSCRGCAACLRGAESVCVKGYTGTIVMGRHGGFQDVIRVPADFSYAIPDAIDSASAAPLLCAGVTVYAPLRKHVKHPGSSVGIIGVGGLGHLAVQFASAMGHSVTAVDMDPTKVKEAKNLGASKFVTFNDAIGDGPQSQANKFDVILNTASGKIDTTKLIDMLKPDGVLVQIGIPGGAIMSVPLQSIVFGQKTIAGSIVGGRADMMEMLETAAIKGVRPIIETYPLNKVNEAMDYVVGGAVRYRVVMLSPGFELEADPAQRINKRW